MGYFRPSDYTITNAIKDRYDSVFVGDNYVMKDHGNYIEVNIDADNTKGHVSFDVYFDENGKIIDVRKH